MSERFEKHYQHIGQNRFVELHERARAVLDKALDEMGYAPGSANHHMQEEVPDLCLDPRFDQATWLALYADPTVDENDYYHLEIRGEIDPDAGEVQDAMATYIDYAKERINNEVLYRSAGFLQDFEAMDLIAPYVDVCSCIDLNALTNAESCNVLEKYIEHGADINSQDSWGNNILTYGDNRPIETLERCIELGADVNARDKFGNTPLFNNQN